MAPSTPSTHYESPTCCFDVLPPGDDCYPDTAVKLLIGQNRPVQLTLADAEALVAALGKAVKAEQLRIRAGK